jgi:hypothetical protein
MSAAYPPPPASSFPLLQSTGYAQTSLPSFDYNCIAWAVEIDTYRIDPGIAPKTKWPSGLPRNLDINTFMTLFGTYGYRSCISGDIENGFQKIAIYAKNQQVTHASRQLPDGRWTSKLGGYVDISHDVTGLNGPLYGSIVLFMRRAIVANNQPTADSPDVPTPSR